MNTLAVRVTLTSVWDEIRLDLPADTPLSEMKRRVLQLSRSSDDPGTFVVKYRGGQLFDEGRSLAELGIVENAALIMLPKRRQPVR